MLVKNAEDMKVAFIDWCRKHDNRKEEYIKQMVGVLSGTHTRFDPISTYLPGCSSAFECHSAEMLEEAYEKAVLSPSNTSSHNQLSASFKKYRDFLIYRDSEIALESACETATIDQQLSEPKEPIEHTSYSDEDFLSEVYVSQDDLIDMKALLKRKKNLILQGSPGTGKTFASKRLAFAMMGEKDLGKIEFVQFHQSTAYDEFVIGYRPCEDGSFVLEEGVFIRFCRKAAQDKNHPYFLIIDEINRANISKVFGELLMLIEADHREEQVTLTAGGSPFSVPNNLYIIGMMNTADRGLALIDYALRRRFAFFEMNPALENASFRRFLEQTKNESLMKLVDAVVALNKTIEKDESLGSGFRIGHSYFCVSNNDINTAAQILKYEIEPLVSEYWFDNKEKVNAETAKLRAAIK